MTEIDDKALDELVARHRANSLSFHYHSREFHRETADAITALRAKVKELEETNKRYDEDRRYWENLHEKDYAGLSDMLKTARQVTREQVRQATDNTNMSGYNSTPSYSAMLEFCHHLGLEIVEDAPKAVSCLADVGCMMKEGYCESVCYLREGEPQLPKTEEIDPGHDLDADLAAMLTAPKAEGRECRCKSTGRDVAGRHVYHCPKSGKEQIGRCTITDGGE